MRLLFEQGLPLMAATLLQKAGHDVLYVSENGRNPFR